MTPSWGQRIRVTGDVGDNVWLDENFDGLQDGAEPGIESVRVNLYGHRRFPRRLDGNRFSRRLSLSEKGARRLLSGVRATDDLSVYRAGTSVATTPPTAMPICLAARRSISPSRKALRISPGDAGMTNGVGDFVWAGRRRRRLAGRWRNRRGERFRHSQERAPRNDGRRPGDNKRRRFLQLHQPDTWRLLPGVRGPLPASSLPARTREVTMPWTVTSTHSRERRHLFL